MNDDLDRPSGRSGSEKRQRSGIVGFRATPGERATLQAEAERADLSLGAYIRGRVLISPETRAARRPVVERVLLSQALAQLGRLNGHLYQIVRHLNFGGVDTSGLRETLAEVRTAGAAVMAALGRRPRA